MISHDDIRAALAVSLEDVRLDHDERDTLRDIVAVVDDDTRRFARNTAFDLARAALEPALAAASSGDARPRIAVLHWLERVCKTLDPPCAAAQPSVSVFSPGHACRNALIQQINAAEQSLDICVFTITDDRLTAAISDAHERGVAVRIVTDNDKANDRGSDADRLAAAGVPLCKDRSDRHMHHKFAVFDAARLATGSFNWTRSASRYNQENILLTSDPQALAAFAAEFQRLWIQWAA